MNIFVLDNNVDLCAQYHVDKHCVKMILETTQLLNNALVANSKHYSPVYKPTHRNHPVSLWAQSSLDNFEWLNRLGLALCTEYTFRYSKIHKCQALLQGFSDVTLKQDIPNNGLTDFALCMPDQYKVSDPIESYRNYYRADKSHIAKWSKRDVPSWWTLGE